MTLFNPPLFGVLLALCLAGCAVGPDYQKPTTNPGPSFANAAQPEFKTKGIEGAWWQQFHDAKLTRLVELAAHNNRDLKAAEANLRQARALFLEAGLELLPHVTSHANYTDQHRSFDSLNRRNFVPRELKLYNVGFDAVWEVDIFGRLRRTAQAREAGIEAAEAERRDLLISVVAEVARNYFLLRGHQYQLAVAQKNADNQRHTLKLTQERQAAGIGTELDTARARAQLDTTLATIPPIDSLIHQDMHRIGVLTGQLPAALVSELAQVQDLPRIPELIGIGQPGDLLRRRPDIRSVERDLAAATANIGVVTADLFPRVTFNGTFALEAQSLTGLGAVGSSGSYNFGPRISWAALNLGQVYARIRAADASAESALARYEQTVLNALEETENALVNYNRVRARQALLGSAAAASEEAYRLAHLRFDEGVENFLTVLDTERRLLEDQRQLAESQTVTATSLVALYKALGGGWEVFSAPPQAGLTQVEQALAP